MKEAGLDSLSEHYESIGNKTAPTCPMGAILARPRALRWSGCAELDGVSAAGGAPEATL